MKLNQITVELQEWLGSDRSIANSAWTSSHDREKAMNKSDAEVKKIVKFMAKHKHGTPFEAVIFRFWMRIPIFTDRQHMTHRIATHNGLSGRYRTVLNDYYHIPEDVYTVMEKAEKGDKHARWIRSLNQGFAPPTFELSELYNTSCEMAVHNYSSGISFLKEAEKEGLITNVEYKRVREVWRGQMPQAGMTERITIMNLRSFANYQKLRNSEHAQPEIRKVAELMLQAVKDAKICPAAIDALEKEGWQI